MKHPYKILISNLKKYSNILKEEDIKQYSQNNFYINDFNFKKKLFFKDVTKETKIKVVHYEKYGLKCTNSSKCLKIFQVYGFDNVLFFFKNNNF